MRDWRKLLVVLPPALGLLAAFVKYVLPLLIAQPHTFEGVVTDERSGKVVQGAKVSFEAKGVPPVMYTDSEGRFSFPLPSGIYEIKIRVEKEGYTGFDRRINIAAKNESEDIRLKPLDSPSPSPTIIPDTRGNKSPPSQKARQSTNQKLSDLEKRKRRAREYLNSNSQV